MTTEHDALRELAELSARQQELIRTLEAEYASRDADATRAATYASYAAAMAQGRTLLARYVPGDFFADPAFDMMLDLFVAAERKETRPVKCCVIASRVPATTTLRYLDQMEIAGLIERAADPGDARRQLVSLTGFAREGMRDWLSAISPTLLRREMAA